MEKMKCRISIVICCLTTMVITGSLLLILSGVCCNTAEAAEKQIALNKQNLTVRTGAVCKLQLMNVPKGKNVEWIVSRNAVAGVMVSDDARSVIILGKKTGTAVITARVDHETYSCRITVKPAISLSSAKEAIIKGKNFTLTLDGTSKTAKWSVTDRKVLKLKKTGKNKYKVTGLTKGSAYVVAVIDGKKYKCKVTVKDPQVVLSKKSLTLNYGTNGKITLKNTSRKVTWKIKDQSIAGIKTSGQSCTITPKLEGTTYVYAVSGGKKYTCKITVKSASKVKFTSKAYSVSLDSPRLQAVLKHNCYPVVKWGIEDNKIAAISNNGTITAKKAGRTRIYAVVDGKKIYASLTVTSGTASAKEISVQVETEIKSNESDKDVAVSVNGNDADSKEKEVQGNTDKYEYDRATFYKKVVSEAGYLNIKLMTIYTNDPDCYFSVDDPDQIITYYLGKGTVDTSGWSDSEANQELWSVRISLIGRKKGTCTVTAYQGNGEQIATSVITITSTDTEYYEYLSWKDQVKAKIWTGRMSDFDKILAVGQCILDHYDYVSDISDYYCFSYGKGGNCTASAGLLCDFAEDLGLEAEEINDIAGMSVLHERARIWFKDGSVYDFDASYVSTAGNRGDVWYIQR